jgi:hypothetical protein
MHKILGIEGDCVRAYICYFVTWLYPHLFSRRLNYMA